MLVWLMHEHLVGMMNPLVSGALRVRKWLNYPQDLLRERGVPVSGEPVGLTLRVVESESQRIREDLRFCDEASFSPGAFGGRGFLEAGRRNRRTNTRGRSLKDFDLHTRLFLWRCSWMIYAEVFDTLPAVLRDAVARWFGGGIDRRRRAHRVGPLPLDERVATREILAATEPVLTCEC